MEKHQYQTNPIYRNRSLASQVVSRVLRKNGGSKNGESCLQYFPWTPEELWSHLLECMKQPGNEWMNENNQGVYDPKTWDDENSNTWKWNLDHIIPQSELSYDSMDHPNFRKCWDLSNLRPLSAKQNILDGANKTRHTKD